MRNSKNLVNFNAFIQYKKFQLNFPKSPEKLKAMQLKKLKKLLSYSYSNFEFYKELMDSAKFDPKKFHDLEELSQLPLITKNDYREFIEYQLKKYPRKYKHYYKDHTSGSTGMPLVVYRTWGERAYLLSKFLRVFFENGYRIFDTSFAILAPTRYSGTDSIIQKLGIMPRIQAPFTTSGEKLSQMLIESKADILYGNVSSLVQIATHMVQNGISMKSLKFCICTGEELDASSAAIVEMAFGKNLINHYGSIELSSMAYRKIGEDYFRFYHDTNLLEILDDSERPSNLGNNVITDFHIYSFPMIRYKLGDCVETEVKNGFPMIKKILGRKDDSVIMKDGSKKSAYFIFEVFGTDKRVRQYKLVQEDFDLFKAEVVISDESEEENLRNDIMERFAEFSGIKANLKVNYVDEIAPESTGKLARFFSKVSKD